MSEVQEAIDAYNAAVEARLNAEHAEREAKRHLGIVGAAAVGLHVGDRVRTRKGEYEVAEFKASPGFSDSSVFFSIYGRKITKAGSPSKGEPVYIGHWNDRGEITKVEAE